MKKKKLIFKLIRILFTLFTLGYIIVYLVTVLGPYVKQQSWWVTSLLGLFFPFLLLGMFLLTIIWIFIKWRYALICGIILLLGWRSIFSTFTFPALGRQDKQHQSETITVMSYNVHQFKPLKGGWADGLQRFWDQIKQADPDIVCLQELDNSKKPHYMAASNLYLTKKALNMSYAYFSRDYYFYDSLVAQGVAIFTRFPVLDSGKVKLSNGSASSSVIYADLLIGSDTIRLMSTHLESFRFKSEDYQDLYKIKHLEKGMFSSLRRIIYRFRETILIQNRQAQNLSKVLRKSPYPVILCGDFNSSPNSYAYFVSKGNLQDSFLERGKGLGSTYLISHYPLRIDYIFADPRLEVLSFRTIQNLLSDHLPVVAKIRLSNP